jgi:hypothetical protein
VALVFYGTCLRRWEGEITLDWSRVAASSLRVVTPVPPSLILGLLPGLENRMPRPVADLLGGGDGQTTPM